MNKWLFLAAFFMLTGITASAQNTIPRFGITPNDDNTGRILTYRYFVAVDNPGADTVNLAPRAWETIILINPVVDSLAFNISSLVNCYVGDRLTFQALNSPGSGHLLKFIGANYQTGSGGPAIALTSGKRANITFRFDGTAWVETGRIVQ